MVIGSITSLAWDRPLVSVRIDHLMSGVMVTLLTRSARIRNHTRQLEKVEFKPATNIQIVIVIADRP